MTARLDIGGSASGCRLQFAAADMVAPGRRRKARQLRRGRGRASMRRSMRRLRQNARPRRGPPELSAARKLWCTVRPVAAAAARLTKAGDDGARPRRSERRRSESGRSRDCPKRGFGERDLSRPAVVPRGASSPKRGCKDMMRVDEVFQSGARRGRRCGPALCSGSPRSCWRACRRPVGPGDRRIGSSGCSRRRRRSRTRFIDLHDELLVIIFADHASSSWGCCFM